MAKRRLIFVVSALLLLFTAKAQQSFMRNFSVSDGLPSYEVYNVFQDSRGFTWFGTDAGVSCYDGYHFRNYTSRDNLADNTIFDFFEDSHQRIWFRSYNGELSYFDGEKIIALPANPQLRSVIDGDLPASLYVDSGDTVWLGFHGKHALIRIMPDFKTVDTRQFSWSNGNYVREMEPGKLLYGFGATPSDSIFVFPFGEKKGIATPGFGNLVVFDATRLNTGEIAFATVGLSVFVKDKKYSSLREPNTIFRFKTWDENSYWRCMGSAGAQLVERNGTEEKILRSVLSGYSVTGCIRDHEGGVWFTTLEKGVFYMPFPEIELVSFNPLQEAEKISTLAVQSDGEMLAGTTRGKIFKPAAPSWEPFISIGGTIFSIFPSAHDALVCSDKSFLFNPVARSSIPVIYKETPLRLVAAADYDSSRYCALSIRSILLVDRHSGKATLFYDLLPERMRCITRGAGDTLWLGGLTGLWYLLPGKKPVSMSAKNPLLGQRMDYLLYDKKKNHLWMSTKGVGLLMMQNGKVVDFSTYMPAVGATCRALYFDGVGNTWVATNAGAFCIYEDYAGFHTKEFSIRNGLPSNDVFGIARSGDTIWVAASDGMVRFNLAQYPHNNVPPPLLLQHVTINGRETGTQSTFGYEENTIAFTYRGISFKCDGQVRYKYRLAGLDTGWTITQSTTTIFYRLAPGTYKFYLYAMNNDGVTDSHPLEFTFVILAPFWQQWWFIAASVIVLLVSILLFLRYRIRRIERKEEENRKLIEMEMTALRAQMNPHFIFNAINSIHNFMLTGDKNTSSAYLAKFARLIRNVLEISRLRKIPLEKEIETLRLYLEIERMRFSDEFSFDIRVDPSLDPKGIGVAPLLLQPYAENAIWHGLLHKKGPGHLDIVIEDAGNSLRCIIDDNGIGREAAGVFSAQTHRESLGGELSRRRIDLLNSLYGTKFSLNYIDKKNTDGSPAGTRIELMIPKVELRT